MKKYWIIFAMFLFCVNNIFNLAFASDFSNITNDAQIKKAIEIINTHKNLSEINGCTDYSIIEILQGAYTKIPIRIEFRDLGKVYGETYRAILAVPYIQPIPLNNGTTAKQITIYINTFCKNAPPEALATLIISKLYQGDTYDSLNEEIYVTSVEAAMWTIFTLENPKLRNVSHPVVHRMNNLRELYIQGNYTSKYIKEFVLKFYGNNLIEKSPGYEQEKTFPFPEEYKRYLINEQNTGFKISDSSLIIDAVNKIKEIPNGDIFYSKIAGNNSTQKPIIINFANISNIDRNFANCYTIWQMKNSRLYIFIDEKYANLPPEAIASLIVGRITVDDIYDSINEEVYAWTAEAIAWSYFTKLKPELKKIKSPAIYWRENILQDFYEKGGYSDIYIRTLVEKNPLYKNLPQTSPGYTQKVVLDNTKLLALDKLQADTQEHIRLAYISENPVLKGYVTQPTSPSVDENKYNAKLAQDKNKYIKLQKTLTKEQYHIYRILDRIIRANNLDFQRWRVGFEYKPEDVNAYATAGNLIIIYSSLYDTLSGNDDAIAFVLCHELSHLLLGHNKITAQNNYTIQQLAQRIFAKRQAASSMAYNSGYYTAQCNAYAAIGFGALALLNNVSANADERLVDQIFEQERQLEYDADTEGFILMYRAGYSLAKASEVFAYLSTLPNVYTSRSTHPPVRNRLENLKLNFKTMIPKWVADGKNNIINSTALDCYKSMDNRTIVIEKSPNYNRSYYAESYNDRLRRIGYNEYKNYELGTSINYLTSLSQREPNNYTHPLYLSYANEYIYKQSHNNYYLKQAKKWAKQASKIAPSNTYIQAQIQELKMLK